jgi:hypothetical protein
MMCVYNEMRRKRWYVVSFDWFQGRGVYRRHGSKAPKIIDLQFRCR